MDDLGASLRMRGIVLILLACLVARPVMACETALLLAVDVSGSISLDEYKLQMEGLATALEDPRIVAALVDGQDDLALVQWSGSQHQRLALRWHTIQTADDVAALAAEIRHIRRPELRTVTAIGQAIRFSLAQFPGASDCARRVIDISGDGAENEGMTLSAARAEAMAAGITINAISIEAEAGEQRLSDYFLNQVITSDGFVVIAKGLADYPRAIRVKLLRELFRNVG
jgi:Ca-activated chloride channel homolog